MSCFNEYKIINKINYYALLMRKKVLSNRNFRKSGLFTGYCGELCSVVSVKYLGDLESRLGPRC